MSIWTFRVKAALCAAAAASSAAAQDAPTSAPASAIGGQGLAVAELEAVDPFGVGALTRAHGALSSDLWSGADVEGALVALLSAPRDAFSPAAARLATRVLMTGGEPPAGVGDRRALAVTRINILADLAHAEAVDALATQAPTLYADPEVGARAVEARLALRRVADACGVGDRVDADARAGFWARLRGACFALAGEPAAAETTLELAREMGADGVDDDLLALIYRAAGLPGSRTPTRLRDGVELTLALAGDVPIETSTLDELTPLAISAVARDPDTDSAVRLAAAHEVASAMQPTELTEIYAAALGPPDRSAEELIAQSLAEASPVKEARLHQAVIAADDPVRKAETMAAALGLAQTSAEFDTAARIYAAEIAFLPITQETLAHAPALIEAAVAAGEPLLARTWLRALRAGAPAAAPRGPIDLAPSADAEDRAAEPDAEEIAYLTLLVAARDAATGPDALAEAARARLALAAGGQSAEEAAMLGRAEDDAAVLLALGARSVPGLRRALRSSVAVSPGLSPEERAAHALLAAAADAGSQAETALLAAGLFARAAKDDRATRLDVVRALQAVGLKEAAREFAAETILASRRGF